MVRYNTRMVRTVEEAEGHLKELVEQASRGEEVLITVDGKVRARLAKAGEALGDRGPNDVQEWLAELRDIRERYSALSAGPTTQEILDELREERV